MAPTPATTPPCPTATSAAAQRPATLVLRHASPPFRGKRGTAAPKSRKTHPRLHTCRPALLRPAQHPPALLWLLAWPRAALQSPAHPSCWARPPPDAGIWLPSRDSRSSAHIGLHLGVPSPLVDPRAPYPRSRSRRTAKQHRRRPSQAQSVSPPRDSNRWHFGPNRSQTRLRPRSRRLVSARVNNDPRSRAELIACIPAT
jgi:hypothetical protein